MQEQLRRVISSSPRAVPTSSRYTSSRLGCTSSIRGSAPAWRASSAGVPQARMRPSLEDGDPVGEVFGLVEVVGGEHDRRAEGAQVLDDLPAPSPGFGVEARGRLVEEDQLRVAGEGEREVEAAPLAAGQPANDLVALGGELDDRRAARRAGAVLG